MIGKLARMAIGRSMARKRGISGGAGAVAGLFAPMAIKMLVSVAAKGARANAAARRRKKAFVQLSKLS